MEDRFREKYEGLDELAASITNHGLEHPLVVKQLVDDPDHDYKLLAGGRRIAACIMIGMWEVPVHIYPSSITEFEERCLELVENAQRQDMSWQDDVLIRRKIHNLYVDQYGEKKKGGRGHSMRDTAAMLSVSPATMSMDIELADALDVVSTLRECKTKQEARQAVNRLARHADTKQRVKEIEVEREKRTEETGRSEQDQIADWYIIGDFFEKSLELEDSTFDICEVDPPYAIDLSEIKSTSGALRAENRTKYNEITKDEYPIFLAKTAERCYELLKDDGWIVWWFAIDPWITVVHNILKETGFRGPGLPALWTKPNAQAQTNNPKYNLGSSYEPFFYMRKGKAEIRTQGVGNCIGESTVLPSSKTHPTERPVDLMRTILATFVPRGTRVLVPFAGSGATLLAAHNLNMTGVGYDLTGAYKEAYVRRVYEGEIGRLR